MPESSDFEQLQQAFWHLEEIALPQIKLAGTDAAHATVRRRRAVRAGLASAAAVLVIASAAATVLLTRGGGHPPVGGTPSPSSSPANSPDPTNSPASLPLLYDGERPTTPVDNKTLDLPDFNHAYCPKGKTKFSGGTWSGPSVAGTFRPAATIADVATGDANGDAVTDHVALITCSAGTDPGAYAAQVVAFTNTGTRIGHIVGVSGGGSYLRQVRFSNGQIQVLHVTAPKVNPPTKMEWRNFRWNGATFSALGTSPITLDLRSPHITTTAQDLRLSADGRGTLTINISNGDGPTLHGIQFAISSALPLTLTPSGTGSPLRRTVAKESDLPYQWIFTVAAVPTGSSGTVVIDVLLDSSAASGTGTIRGLALGIGVDGQIVSSADESNEISVNVSR